MQRKLADGVSLNDRRGGLGWVWGLDWGGRAAWLSTAGGCPPEPGLSIVTHTQIIDPCCRGQGQVVTDMPALMTLTSATANARPLFGRLPGALSARPCAWRPRTGAGGWAGWAPRLPTPAQLARGPAPPRANFFQEAWGTNNAEELQV